ncbi:MAG: glycosyltransferase family 2 protein [Saprospiraceae bacterium]
MNITIITATYNSAITIQDTLASIQSQNFPSVEHLIIDGNSQDNTLEVVKSFNPLLKIISEPDNGLYDAMNKGIRLANGSIIGILNSDDFYPNPNVLSHVASCFQQENCDLVYGDLLYVDLENTHKIIRRWRAKPWKKDKFLFGWMPPHPTLFVRREVYQEYGLFNTGLRFSADYEFMIRTVL